MSETTGEHAGEELDDDEYEADHRRRKYRRQRKKVREAALEIKELNITAMMDMMTILLVFLIRSYTASPTTINLTDDLQVPKSTTQAKVKEDVIVTVSAKEILVNDKTVAPVINGVIPGGYREGQAETSSLVTPLMTALQTEVEKQKYIAKYNPAQPFTGRINIIADKRIPYQTILAVLYTAGQAEFGQYKLMALKNE